jgi:RNA polymerase-interacting CarD/CdnL/TRCF family regulator
MVEMEFQTGVNVVHHSFGVGTVASIETMSLSGGEPRLFYRVEFARTTVWVPMDDESPAGLRPVTSSRQLPRYRRLLAAAPTTLDEDFRKRQVELELRKSEGTFESLCELVRDLSARQRLKTLNQWEKNLLRNTLEALVGEWAAAAHLSEEAARKEIALQLRLGEPLATAA